MNKKRRNISLLLAMLVLAIVVLLLRQCDGAPNGGCTRAGDSFSDTISMSGAATLPGLAEGTTDDSALTDEGKEAQIPTKNLEYVLSVEPDRSVAEAAEALLAAESPEGVMVYFRQGSATLDSGYMSNGEALARLAEMLQPYLVADATGNCTVHISSSVSPEGPDYINDHLITARAEAISQWIRSHFDVEIDYSLGTMGIDWERLIVLVDDSEGVPYKQEVLDILRNHSDDSGVREQRLRSLHGGEPYAYIYRNFYPYLRYAVARVDITCEVAKEVVDTVVVESPAPEEAAPEEPEQEAVPEEPIEEPAKEVEEEQPAEQPEEEVVEEPKSTLKPFVPFYGALKTNALYDLALIPNIGAEIMLGDHFSIGANWHYAWWKSDAINWYWRTYGGDVSIHYWFGKRSADNPLTGHHIGAYGQIVTYDFLAGKNGILADRWSWDAGVEYGYAMPLTEHLNLDFTLGVGYHTGQFYEYTTIDDCYVWQATKNRKYFGPTKFEVSLVWHFGTKQTKGGDR